VDDAMLHVKNVVSEIVLFIVKLVLQDTLKTFKVSVSYVVIMIHVKLIPLNVYVLNVYLPFIFIHLILT